MDYPRHLRPCTYGPLDLLPRFWQWFLAGFCIRTSPCPWYVVSERSRALIPPDSGLIKARVEAPRPEGGAGAFQTPLPPFVTMATGVTSVYPVETRVAGDLVIKSQPYPGWG